MPPFPSSWRRILASSFCAGLLIASTSSADDKVNLNFVNADIEPVVKAIAQAAGKTVVVDPRVKGSLNLSTPEPVERRLAFDILLSALRLQGIAAVESQGVVKLLPEADAKFHASPVAGRKALAGDQIQTKVYSLRYESAAQMANALRPLVSPNNPISSVPGSNALVITDYADNLRRLDAVVASMDQPVAGEPVIIPVNHLSAVDLANTLTRLFAASQGGDAMQRVDVVADARSNRLLVRADSPARLSRVQRLVEGLDVPAHNGTQVNMVHLKNAEAVKVAQTLRAVLSGEAPLAMNTSTAGATNPQGASAGSLNSSSGLAAMVQADPATNTLIITGPEGVYNSLRAVIEKLDVRRAQIYVEALIVEVSAQKAAELGVQWMAGFTAGSAKGVAISTLPSASNPGIANIASAVADKSSNVAVGSGLSLGLVGSSKYGNVPSLAVLARALEGEASANILSTPTLLTLDNEEAKIIVGQNVPFITGQYALSGGATTPTPFQTVERRDVGLTLRIKPQITEGGVVRLAVFQEVSSVDDKTNQAGIITNKRSIESNVLVDDGRIVAIGGLLQDSASDGADKVPGLGDLPLLGGLFRYDSKKRSKTNLMVFLRPQVVRDAEGYAATTASRYREMQDAQTSKAPAKSLLPDLGAPSLPPLPAKPAATQP
ncbi:type II secretion system secretin GspD [Denitratisoma oestradiolicum]|uniref:Type II secretion system protein GspD n=1 Tax=Denitratisoma oestradiolicum TaxID=311182 RepID=A0A6S6Y5P0_9PROT|nr:type II secretion system secretin GspD [Denitratisoma oestradiolicum]TWO79194.1 type II secretion system protein GspD [Denitratisoma oestradiolicum]CAB1370837.1 Type II secretion system protein GspD [Denitratisoma oestradiolicum]